MTSKCYNVYFNRDYLKVDKDGHLENPDVLKIIELVFDDEISEEPIDIRRVNKNGEVMEEYPDLSDLEYSGDDDDPSIDKALTRFYDWLHDHLVWTELYHATYWEPAEYICIGIDGCVPTAEDLKWDWWDNGGKEQTLYDL